MGKVRSLEPTGHDRHTSVSPVSVSQLTSLAVLGIDRERYLRLVRRHPEIARACGKLRVARVDAVLRALEVEDRLVHDAADRAEGAVPTTIDGVLARIGRRRVAKETVR